MDNLKIIHYTCTVYCFTIVITVLNNNLNNILVYIHTCICRIEILIIIESAESKMLLFLISHFL